MYQLLLTEFSKEEGKRKNKENSTGIKKEREKEIKGGKETN